METDVLQTSCLLSWLESYVPLFLNPFPPPEPHSLFTLPTPRSQLTHSPPLYSQLRSPPSSKLISQSLGSDLRPRSLSNDPQQPRREVRPPHQLHATRRRSLSRDIGSCGWSQHWYNWGCGCQGLCAATEDVYGDDYDFNLCRGFRWALLLQGKGIGADMMRETGLYGTIVAVIMLAKAATNVTKCV